VTTLYDGTVREPSAPTPPNGQRPFRLQHDDEPAHVYGLGAELDDAALLLTPNPYTGYPTFHRFVSPGEALLWLQAELGGAIPLILVWDERPIEKDIPFVEEDVDLVKPLASWRPHPTCPR
jgi:hypothetical protein